ncbi:hypothetical protein, partial [Brachybacterium sp. UMB0905]|uniref:hypothetical protein n=1 Tax=Brachybacterium sp. UMB0905 TaxID=2069310 RepID=UPI000CCAA857
MAYVRKVRTASGAVAVQVVQKSRGRLEVFEHVGSAHTDGVCQGFRTVDVFSGGQATTGRVVGVVCSVHALAG